MATLTVGEQKNNHCHLSFITPPVHYPSLFYWYKFLPLYLYFWLTTRRIFILLVWSDFHMINNLSIAVHVFVPSSGRVDTAIWMHDLDANKTAGEKARRQLLKNAASNIEQVLEATPHKTPTIRPSTSHHKNYPS